MAIFRILGGCILSVRELVWPSYQPERHYMRGPGPACAKRSQKTGSAHRLQF